MKNILEMLTLFLKNNGLIYFLAFYMFGSLNKDDREESMKFILKGIIACVVIAVLISLIGNYTQLPDLNENIMVPVVSNVLILTIGYQYIKYYKRNR